LGSGARADQGLSPYIPSPDFTALKTDGQAFRLSEVLGKRPIAIYFAAYDG
jgi:hypothetical protein